MRKCEEQLEESLHWFSHLPFVFPRSNHFPPSLSQQRGHAPCPTDGGAISPSCSTANFFTLVPIVITNQEKSAAEKKLKATKRGSVRGEILFPIKTIVKHKTIKPKGKLPVRLKRLESRGVSLSEAFLMTLWFLWFRWKSVKIG